MKLLIILALVAVALTRHGECYDSKYDDFNVDELIENDRLLRSYCLCLLEKGKCTPEGTDFKKWMPEALSTSCSKCTEKQKHLVAKTISAVKAKLPTEYTDLINKYDPEGKHAVDIETFLSKYKS